MFLNTLRFVSAKEETQIYGAILPESLTSPEMKETKAYKTYLGFATGATPLKKARKFKKQASPQLTTVLVSTEEPIGKSKRENNEDDSNNEQDSSGIDSNQENDSNDDKTQSDNENESDSEYESDENESNFEYDHQENKKEDADDDEEVEGEFVKTSSNNSNDEDETKNTGNDEGDEDEEMDYATSQLYDDVDIRLNEPVDIDKGFVQEKGTNAAMTNVQ
ncbi:hypothetical protein Tco_0907328 [Tanacetum coccineum]|uniref:Uncharacterized protein n=1 Tax=Tanacetum coccineum TaxID=301880 RepID=A0ABQ5CJV2_9ASTR